MHRSLARGQRVLSGELVTPPVGHGSSSSASDAHGNPAKGARSIVAHAVRGPRIASVIEPIDEEQPVTETQQKRRPVNDAARERLRDAQKAEANALRLVGAAEKVRERAQRALEKAEHSLAQAQAGLVKVSGADRAALLLDEPVGALRTRLRQVGASTRRVE